MSDKLASARSGVKHANHEEMFQSLTQKIHQSGMQLNVDVTPRTCSNFRICLRSIVLLVKYHKAFEAHPSSRWKADSQWSVSLHAACVAV